MGQQSISVLDLTFLAGGNVAARRAIGFNGTQATVQGQKVMGVSTRPVVNGTHSDASVVGTAVIETGGAFTVGASLIVDSQARAIAASGKLAIATAVTSVSANGSNDLTGADLPEYVFADALEASTGAGQWVEVFLRR